MSKITFVNPVNQPVGTFRLLDWLDNNFKNNDYQNFRCLVAFAKINPFYKLHASIQIWNSAQKSSEAIIGIDHKGTSYQALQYAMANFDTTRILHTKYSTFHPKLYIFYGINKAAAYYGSSNFTSGGLETNFEGGVIIEFDLPNDQYEFDELLKNYTSLSAHNIACTKILTPTLLKRLQANDFLLDETKKLIPPAAPKPVASPAATHTSTIFGNFITKPPRPIPKAIMTAIASNAGLAIASPTNNRTTGTKSAKIAKSSTTIVPLITNGFVTQIAPHNNGEILLSKLGVNQNKAFFGYPFTGFTTPKKSSNPSYPQRTPDPVVNIYVYDSAGILVNTKLNYHLNMVYYTKKSEIRITVTPSIISALAWTLGSTNFPILVMELSTDPGIDYKLSFYAQGSAVYSNYLAICNQVLPSGGNPISRKIGWF